MTFEPQVAILAGLIFLLAGLYSSVGHGGASGYLAAMGLFGLSPLVMKPTALFLNVLVAGLALLRFRRAEAFSWRAILPFAATSIPMAFLGGWMLPPQRIYLALVSVVLTFAAVRLLRGAAARKAESKGRPVPLRPSLAWGAGIGFLSGLTGVGGGIFLHPLLQLTGWAAPRPAAGMVAAFVLVNSVAGLAGHGSSAAYVPAAIAVWAPAGLAGAWLGTTLGTRRLSRAALQRTLAVVLLLAAARMGFAALA